MQRYIRPKSLHNRNIFPRERGCRGVCMQNAISQSPQIPRVHSAWLVALLVIAAIVRLPGIERPLTGNFATKNVVYAMIARNWAENRAGLLEPTLDCLVGGQRSLHLLELPVSAYLTGLVWKGLGGSLDVWGRLTALGFTLGSVALLCLLVARWHGPLVATVAGLVLALSPVSIVYGRSFMLEPSLVFFMVAMLWAWQHWLDSGRCGWLVAAAMGLVLASLTKVYVLVVLAPMVAMAWHTRPRKAVVGALVLAAAIVPAGAWYWHAATAAGPGSPVANRVYYSVRSTIDVHRPPHPLLGSVGFYRRVGGDLLGPVLTPLGLALLVAGLANPAWRRHAAWLAGSMLLILLLPRKFYEMNYYWMAVLPLLAIFVGLGWQWVQERFQPGRWVVVGLLLLAALLAARFSVGPMVKTAEEDRGVVAAGSAVQRLTRPDEPVVTMHGTTIDLLYYCRRPGWAIESSDPQMLGRCCQQGASVLAVAGAEPLAEARWPGIDTQLLARGPGFAVYRIACR